VTLPEPELSVIILSTGADPNLVGAVDSVLAQSVACQIIVANSGGGDVGARLGAMAPRVTIVESPKLLYPGGARNLGLGAATAPYIAFLACDCRATRGWAKRRLKHHKAGAAAVACALHHDRPWNLVSWADHLLIHARRLPHLPAHKALRYGVSFSRQALQRYGAFDETLRIGEDTEYLNKFSQADRPVWAPGIITIHRNSRSLAALLSGQYHRGRRSGAINLKLRGRPAGASVRAAATAAARVPRLAWLGLRGRDRWLALASLPIYAMGLAARLLGIWSSRKTGSAPP